MNHVVSGDVYLMPIQKCIAGEDVKALSDTELMAIILATGTKERDVLELASDVLRCYGGISGVARTGIRELAQQKGIGLKKAIKIHAAMQMGKRSIVRRSNPIILNAPQKVWELLLPDVVGLQQEEFRVFILNNKNRLLKNKVVSRGTVSEAIVHPREIFQEAIRESGSSIIVSHNHPSGVLTPSQDDIQSTRRLTEAGKILGIELLDHVIVSETDYLSMKEDGYL